MKKNISFTKIAILLPIFALTSCGTDQIDDLVNPVAKTENMNQSTEKKVIFYAAWDGEWGRTSKQCNGFGLCEFYSCWFCEPVKPNQNVSKVEYDDTTNKGIMYIELTNDGAKQSDAISTKGTLYIDNDLTSESMTVHQGEYSFDSTIGEYGGYKVDVTVK